jgi:branched-chain amino acid transport system ATP-binding protein
MTAVTGMKELLLEKVTHRYNGVLALNQVSVEIDKGSFTAILGPNGAGKSTLALILGGMLRPTSGSIIVQDIDRYKTHSGNGFINLGIVLVPEGRRLFTTLTVRENLLLGAYGSGQSKVEMMKSYKDVLEFLPELKRHLEKPTGLLSGGEQQMVAVARALMAKPNTVILDEPSLGLAPKMIERIYEVISELNSRSMTVIVIEQMATYALQHAQNMVVLDGGLIRYHGSVTNEAANAALQEGYFGTK